MMLIPSKAPIPHRGSFNLQFLRITINIDSGRNTEPRYDILFDNNASFSVDDRDKDKYPMLTTKIEENKRINHDSFFLIISQYAVRSRKAEMDVAIYTDDIVAALLPTAEHPPSENNASITQESLKSLFTIKETPEVICCENRCSHPFSHP